MGYLSVYNSVRLMIPLGIQVITMELITTITWTKMETCDPFFVFWFSSFILDFFKLWKSFKYISRFAGTDPNCNTTTHHDIISIILTNLVGSANGEQNLKGTWV